MNLEVEVGGLTFKNPIIIGSAGYAEDENGLTRFIKRGYAGIVTKSTSKRMLSGSPPPRVFWFDPYAKTWIEGSEGHRNPGIEQMAKTIKTCSRLAREENCHLIGSVSCSSIDEAKYVASKFEEAGASAVEIDMICHIVGEHLGPEYKGRGRVWGKPENPQKSIELINAVKKTVDIPVWPKIHPSTLYLVGDLIEQKSNPDAFTFIGSELPNYPLGLGIDIKTGKPLFSGGQLLKIKQKKRFTPYAILFPVLPTTVLTTALFRNKLKTLLVPSGGVTRGFDAIQCMMAGASAVEVCTVIYRDLDVIKKMEKEITWFMNENGYTSLKEIVGIAVEHIPFSLIDIGLPTQPMPSDTFVG
jgi:dihydroorotate dehydrogenase (NAD+) catalytic subunit